MTEPVHWIAFVLLVVAGYYAVTWTTAYLVAEARRRRAEIAEREAKEKSRVRLVEEVWEIDDDFKLKLRALRSMELPDDARQVW
jgi:hypothetical protein